MQCQCSSTNGARLLACCVGYGLGAHAWYSLAMVNNKPEPCIIVQVLYIRGYS